jgi:hypothetical protein
VVNILTGSSKELGSWLASHMDVNAIDLEGSANAAELELLAAENLKRVIRQGSYPREGSTGTLQHILDLMEVKTVWHPKGH